MPRITCHCDNEIDIDVPEFVDFDADPGLASKLAEGSFFAVTCPSCGAVLKPEFPIVVRRPSIGMELKAVPLADSGEFLARAKDEPSSPEAVIGYAELADRVAVLAAGLDPLVVEALKFYLLRKAEEAVPDADASIWFASAAPSDSIEFHIHGLREDEIAVSRIPFSVYEKMKLESAATPEAEPYASLRVGPYLSVRNLLVLGADS